MRINHLDLSNFRCFKERSFAFHQRFTLLIGANATGKTAILDALAVALGAALIPVPHAPNGPIRYRDVRRTHHPIGETGHFTEHYPVRVEARGSIEDRDQAPRSHRSTSGPAGKDRARTETPGVVLIDEMLDDDDDDNPKTFRPYYRAKADLLGRLGDYCSYCERRGDLHVEHVVPRCRRPDLAEDWTNFLVGCTSCNGIKRDRNQSRDGYLWPDEDDTRAAFEYLPDGIVQVQPDLSEHDRAQATSLLELVGLGRRPAANPRASDMRWRKRREALAAAGGFWSVWMTVFADLPRVCDQCHPTREDDGRGVTAGRSPRRC